MFPCFIPLVINFLTVLLVLYLLSFAPLFPKNKHVPLFPSILCQCSLVPQNPWEMLIVNAHCASQTTWNNQEMIAERRNCILRWHPRCGRRCPSLKGHSHPWDRATLDTSFLTLKKGYLNPKSKLRVEYIYKSASIFAVSCAIFNRSPKNRFLSVLLFILW